MIDITSKRLSREAYFKAIELGLATWTNYQTGEIYIKRQAWRALTPGQKLNVIKEIEGLICNDADSYSR